MHYSDWGWYLCTECPPRFTSNSVIYFVHLPYIPCYKKFSNPVCIMITRMCGQPFLITLPTWRQSTISLYFTKSLLYRYIFILCISLRLQILVNVMGQTRPSPCSAPPHHITWNNKLSNTRTKTYTERQKNFTHHWLIIFVRFGFIDSVRKQTSPKK